MHFVAPGEDTGGARVTHSAAPFHLDLFYAAVYVPGHLDSPIAERVGYVGVGQNNVLCK